MFYFDFVGKIWKFKVELKLKEEEEYLETEWDDILIVAFEEEFVDFVVVFGFYGMFN